MNRQILIAVLIGVIAFLVLQVLTLRGDRERTEELQRERDAQVRVDHAKELEMTKKLERLEEQARYDHDRGVYTAPGGEMKMLTKAQPASSR